LIELAEKLRATPHAMKKEAGSYWRSKTRQLHFAGTTEMLERRAEVVEGHDTCWRPTTVKSSAATRPKASCGPSKT
jgi:hypothetical protein